MVRVHDDLPRDAHGEIDVQTWLSGLDLPESDHSRQMLEIACQLASEFGRERQTPFGETCLQEGLVIARILYDLDADIPTLTTAVLFPSFRYAHLSEAEVENALSPAICKMLSGVLRMEMVSVVSHMSGTHGEADRLDNLRRMLLAVVEDIRVVLVKLAERTAAVRACRYLSEDAQKQISKEVQEIYAPLANRLGIGQIKWELEDLAYRFSHPEEYKRIAKLLDEKRIDRQDYIHHVVDTLSKELEKQSVKAEVFGRAKHIYSIARKMRRKNLPYGEIYDIRAVRILVDSLPACYAALGVVHSLWHHIPKEFDDYIANPKENGYRSLHTAVIGPAGKTLEIQIRTDDMHRESEMGVAAHWRYKEGGVSGGQFDRKIAELRQLLDSQMTLDEQWDTGPLRTELFEDRVYVFTPKGDVWDLPKGATPIDLAYHIHTELGHRCRGARVNDRMVSLTYRLKSGQRVELLTVREGGPSRDWLNPDSGYIASSRSRAKILQWFKREAREEHVLQGRAIVEAETKRLGIKELGLDALAEKLNVKTGEDVLVGLGSGDIGIGQVLNAYQRLHGPLGEQVLPDSQRELLRTRPSRGEKDHPDILIEGVGQLMSHLANCCHPLPGDSIVGFVTLGRGVSVHRADCQNILESLTHERHRLIEVSWGRAPAKTYPVDIVIEAMDRKGLLRDVTGVLTAERINVTKVNTFSNSDSNTATLKLGVEIADLSALSRLMAKLQQLPNVTAIHRVRQQ